MSKTTKIILIVVAVIIVCIVAYKYFSKKKVETKPKTKTYAQQAVEILKQPDISINEDKLTTGLVNSK